MLRYLLKKIPSILIVVAATSVIAFLLPRFAPGDPARVVAGPDATQAQVDALREQMGLDQPLVSQFLNWAGGVLRGDLGTSFYFRTPVAELISSRLESTLELTALATILLIAIGLLLGAWGGSVRSRLGRAVSDTVNTVLLATPAFLTGLLLILALGIVWRVLPVSGEVGLLEDPNAGIQYLILPALALALPQAAQVSRLLQTSMLTVRGEDFVDLALSKGATPVRITYRHVIPNSVGAPIVSIGIAVGEMLGGAIIVESIFARNGLGQLAVSAVSNRDYFVIQALILGAVLVVVIIQLLTEVIIAALDPRIRLEAV